MLFFINLDICTFFLESFCLLTLVNGLNTGEVGRMYEANVDDVGYRLVAVYTPIREDGFEGQPVSASTDPISVGRVQILFTL